MKVTQAEGFDKIAGRLGAALAQMDGRKQKAKAEGGAV